MLISDISVKRPVFASVLSLLLIAFGAVSYSFLPLREYPDIDPPVVSVETTYIGASAAIVETKITQLIEDRIAGIEGIKFIQSSSEDGESSVTIEFDVERDIDAAANDVREAVSGIVDDLPDEADPPQISKANSDDDVILWLNLNSDQLDVLELTDYADRYLVDRFSVVSGVARVRLGGGVRYALRVWIDPDALAARNLTINDVEDALRRENVELPAGSVESVDRHFGVRVQRSYRTPEEFERLVIARGANGHLVRLGEVARVELGGVQSRIAFNGNGEPMIGLGIIKQSKANTLAVAQGVNEALKEIRPNLPEGMVIANSYDTSVFIDASVKEVYKTLFLAVGLVALVIFLFIGKFRAALIPTLTVPISLVATFIFMYAVGFSLNLLTLLGLVLAIGLVVDDAIVVLENIARRVEEGEPPLRAAFEGGRQVGFAVIATTLVLVAVFVPIVFLEGDLGRLFIEFALTMAAAVCFSSLIALTLTPMLCSKLLTNSKPNIISRILDGAFNQLRKAYGAVLRLNLAAPWIMVLIVGGTGYGAYALYGMVPQAFTPQEDRGAFFVLVNAPEGSSYAYTKEYMDEIERRMMYLVESGEATRLLVRTPRSFGGVAATFNNGIVIVVLEQWGQRRSAFAIMNEVRGKLADLPGVRAFPVMRQGFGGGFGKPLQVVLGGPDYDTLAGWRDTVLEKARENENFLGLDSDYKETKPQIGVTIDTQRAGDLGVSVLRISQALQSLLGSKRVTTFLDRGEEYDVIIEGAYEDKETPLDLKSYYVRSDTSGQLVALSNLVILSDYAESSSLNRYNRQRSITIEANLADGYTLGQGLDSMVSLIREELPEEVSIGFKGQSLDLQESSGSVTFVFILAVAVVFLVLAAQFESYIHPLVIMFTVPLAVAGALGGLYLGGFTLNIYSQIGLIMLVGLATKNGILIVEFANQLRDEGWEFQEAIVEASLQRFRPIVMTSITTAMGSVPLIIAAGAGSETRQVIGTTVLSGVLFSTVLTLFVVPVFYRILAGVTTSPNAVAQELHGQIAKDLGDEEARRMVGISAAVAQQGNGNGHNGHSNGHQNGHGNGHQAAVDSEKVDTERRKN